MKIKSMNTSSALLEFNADNLRALMIEKELMKVELASILGVTKQAIWSWEQGKSMPCEESMDKLCELSGKKRNHFIRIREGKG